MEILRNSIVKCFFVAVQVVIALGGPPVVDPKITANFDNISEAMMKRWFETELDENNFNFTDKQWTWFNSLTYLYKPRHENGDVNEYTNEAQSENSQFCEEITSPITLTRKEWRRLNADMRKSFTDAFNALTQFYPDPSDDKSAYHILVIMHTFQMAPGAHYGAGLLPWHREYVWRFSNALRQQGYTGDMPYFDSMLDEHLPNPEESALWTEQHYGVSQGEVGLPFINLTVTPHCINHTNVHRKMITDPVTAKFYLFSQWKLDVTFNYTCYRDLTMGWHSDPLTSFERFHDGVHIFIDGIMYDPLCSPHDPAFFLHHTYLDLLWEEFRQNYQMTNLETEYPLTKVGFVPAHQKWNSVFKPFDGVRPGGNADVDGAMMVDGLSNKYTNFWYRYEPRPSTIVCSEDIDCTSEDGSDILWCDVTTSSCKAKIREQGRCVTSLPDRQCWCPTLQAVCDITTETCQCE